MKDTFPHQRYNVYFPFYSFLYLMHWFADQSQKITSLIVVCTGGTSEGSCQGKRSRKIKCHLRMPERKLSWRINTLIETGKRLFPIESREKAGGFFPCLFWLLLTLSASFRRKFRRRKLKMKQAFLERLYRHVYLISFYAFDFYFHKAIQRDSVLALKLSIVLYL